MNLRQIAHALGGEVSGQQVFAPGPGHSKRIARYRCVFRRTRLTASSRFRTPATTGASVATTFAASSALSRRDEGTFPAPGTFKPAAATPDMRTRDAARRLFAESVDPRGTLAEHYLAHERGLAGVIDDMLALTLRFHPRYPSAMASSLCARRQSSPRCATRRRPCMPARISKRWTI